MRRKKYAGYFCAGAVAAATVVSLLLALPGGGASAAAALTSLLCGPVQALNAAQSLAQQADASAPQSMEMAQSAAAAAQSTLLPAAPQSVACAGEDDWAPAQPQNAIQTAAAPADGVNDTYALTDESAPDGAGQVIEKNYTQTVGGIYTACGAGTIRNNTSTSEAEIASAVSEGLPFAVTPGSAEPQVLILHTHATETYRTHTGLWFAADDTARSTDTNVDMCAVGRVMTDTLNAAGIRTLHDETLNDYPSYTGSYENSRTVAQRYLKDFPSIKVILDVHRDAIESSGTRVAPVSQINGRQSAQVMVICGCDNGGSIQIPNCRQNLRFAAAWETQMEGMYPGLTRPVLYSYRFYNQDLSTGALLIEVGGHGNTLDEALYAGHMAAQALAALFGA